MRGSGLRITLVYLHVINVMMPETCIYSAQYIRLVSCSRLPQAVRGFAPRRFQEPNQTNLDSPALGLRNGATYAKNGELSVAQFSITVPRQIHT